MSHKYEIRLLNRFRKVLDANNDISSTRHQDGSFTLYWMDNGKDISLGRFQLRDNARFIIHTDPNDQSHMIALSLAFGKAVFSLQQSIDHELAIHEKKEVVEFAIRDIHKEHLHHACHLSEKRMRLSGGKTEKHASACIKTMEAQANVLAASLLVLEDIRNYRNAETRARTKADMPSYIMSEILNRPALIMVMELMSPRKREHVTNAILSSLTGSFEEAREHVWSAAEIIFESVKKYVNIKVYKAGLEQFLGILVARNNLHTALTTHKLNSLLRANIQNFMDTGADLE